MQRTMILRGITSRRVMDGSNTSRCKPTTQTTLRTCCTTCPECAGRSGRLISVPVPWPRLPVSGLAVQVRHCPNGTAAVRQVYRAEEKPHRLAEHEFGWIYRSGRHAALSAAPQRPESIRISGPGTGICERTVTNLLDRYDECWRCVFRTTNACAGLFASRSGSSWRWTAAAGCRARVLWVLRTASAAKCCWLGACFPAPKRIWLN